MSGMRADKEHPAQAVGKRSQQPDVGDDLLATTTGTVL